MPSLSISLLALLLLACSSEDTRPSSLNCGWDESDISPLVNNDPMLCRRLEGGPELNFTSGADTPCSAPGGTLGRCARLLPGQRVRAWSPLFSAEQAADSTYMPCEPGEPVCTR